MLGFFGKIRTDSNGRTGLNASTVARHVENILKMVLVQVKLGLTPPGALRPGFSLVALKPVCYPGRWLHR